MSVFGVILLRISPYSVQMRENTDQNNSEYGQSLRRAFLKYKQDTDWVSTKWNAQGDLIKFFKKQEQGFGDSQQILNKFLKGE